MDYKKLLGKSICMLMENADKKDDIHAYLGAFQFEDDQWYFVNESQGWKVALDTEQLSRLKPTPEQLRSILLNADYFIPVTVQALPDDDPTGYIKTNMKWHK